jgi:hypothetical protein
MIGNSGRRKTLSRPANETKKKIAQETQTNLIALVRSNIEGLLRQMTHDHVVPKLDPTMLKRYKKPVSWHTLVTLTAHQPKQKARLESLVQEITGIKDWHVQGPHSGYPPASLAALSERSGIRVRRLTQVLYPEKSTESLGNQLTLGEALSLCAATNIALQQLLTPPWWAISKLEYADHGEVDYLMTFQSIPTDRWVSWLYSLEPLPYQDEHLFERNMSHPPPLGPRIDDDGRRVNRNRGVDIYDVNELDEQGLFSEKSWRPQLNTLNLFEVAKPSEVSSVNPDPVWHERHLSAMYWISGFLGQLRRLLRVARRRGTSKRLDVFWEVTMNNVAHLVGRLSRLRRQETSR